MPDDALLALAQRTRDLQAALQDLPVLLAYAGNPNGSLTAQESTLCWDSTNRALYVNTSTGSGADWTRIASSTGGGGAPDSASYLTLALHAGLSGERRFVPAARLAATDGGANADYTLDLATTGVAAGTYGSATQVPQITTDAYGRLTAASAVTISGVSPSAHNLLDATYHGDAATGSIARGDLLYGNATPKVARLPLGGITGSILTRDANDVAWSAYALVGTAGQTYTLSATGGTVPIGTGTAGRLAEWATASTLQASTLAKTGAGVLTLSAAGAYTLTVPATGTSALGAGTLTVATLNDVTGAAHLHAITSSSNPGAAASLLATDATGYLQLSSLGAGTTAQFQVDANGDIVKLKNLTYTWPAAHTANGVLTNDGSGGLSWATVGASVITPDSLDFSEFKDNMTLDATTDIAMGGFNLTTSGAGSVGIGTTTPTAGYKLDVAGFINSEQTVNQSTYPSVNAVQTAATLQDGSAYTGTDITMATQYIAVKFVASAAHTMGCFTVRVKASAPLTNPLGTITGYIYADDGGSPSKPTGAALATGLSIRFGALTTSYQELSLGTTYNMASGLTYWLVIKYSAAPTGGNIIFDSDVSADAGATSTDGSTWTNTTARLRYKIRGITQFSIYGASTNNYGVYGTSTNHIGVYGASTNHVGVRGISTNYFGVYGTSTNHIGVYGISTNHIGVYGASTNNVGVYGISTNYFGVQGISTNSAGIYGSSTTNRSGYFYRNSSTATSVNFEIISDHVSDTQTVARVQGDGTGDLVNIFDGATEVFTLLDGGSMGLGITAPVERLEVAGKIALRYPASASDTITDVLLIEKTYGSAAAAGFGAGISFLLKDSTTASQSAARVTALWYDATHATRKGDVVLSAYDYNSEREGLRVRANGSAPAIAFYGGTPRTRAAALTAQLTTITYTAPTTPDYAIQDFVDVAGDGSKGYAFASKDEANTLLAVIANLQARVQELENALNATTGVNLIA